MSKVFFAPSTFLGLFHSAIARTEIDQFFRLLNAGDYTRAIEMRAIDVQRYKNHSVLIAVLVELFTKLVN